MLAPWVYHAVQAAALLPVFQTLAAQPFHRYVNRVLLVCALLGVAPLLRAGGVRSLADLGWPRPGVGEWRWVAAGFCLGWLGLALIALVAGGGGARVWRPEVNGAMLARVVLGATLSAVAVAVLEETLFRGVLQGTLRRGLGPALAVAISSAVYAALHFLARVRWEEPVTWHSGLTVLGRMLAHFGDPAQVAPGFLNLMLAGVVLGLAFERTGSLFFSAGLHAGWVFWLKLYAALTRAAPERASVFWGGDKLTEGWAVLPALALTAALLPRRRPRGEPEGASS